jgi:hypothetical protein
MLVNEVKNIVKGSRNASKSASYLILAKVSIDKVTVYPKTKNTSSIITRFQSFMVKTVNKDNKKRIYSTL